MTAEVREEVGWVGAALVKAGAARVGAVREELAKAGAVRGAGEGVVGWEAEAEVAGRDQAAVGMGEAGGAWAAAGEGAGAAALSALADG